MRTWVAVMATLGVLSFTPGGSTPANEFADGLATAATAPAEEELADDELAEITVTAPEPRYAAPTTRDRIGRVWVPVHIDGVGPFRLVLDTGAQRSAIVPKVAQALGIPLDRSPPVRLHGVTGTAIVPTVEVELLQVGDVWMRTQRLPVVADVFGGADGLLGMDGMEQQRIYIDFRSDYVNISRSRDQRAASGFIVVPVLRDATELLMVDGEAAGVRVRAVLDTGAQATVGNEALRKALRRTVARNALGEEAIHGATGDVQIGFAARIPSINLGALQVRDAHITFSDLHIFSTWELTDTPALLIGMDILGLVDTLIIDYRRREMQIRPRRG